MKEIDIHMVKELSATSSIQYSYIEPIALTHGKFDHDNIQILDKKKPRHLGSIYTPPDFAQFLTSWAIQSPEQKILDIGVGEGAFIFAAYQRLLQLGAKPSYAQQQLYGAEIDIPTYNQFSKLSKADQVYFPNLHNANFFEVDFPSVDVVVGNPPYVRRNNIENVDEIRNNVFKRNFLIKETEVSRTTDLYIYFLLQALAVLKEGGRLAVITADPWLNVGYGESFKKFLQQYFEIESLISLDRRIFDDALVKPILLLARKKEATNLNWFVNFVRVKNELPVGDLQQILDHLERKHNDIVLSKIKSSELNAISPWSIHFKVPEVYEELVSNELMTPIRNVAETRIGFQTLAKDFFVLTTEKTKINNIEKEFLVPLAQSLRFFDKPVIGPALEPKSYLFYCSKSKEDLQGTQALAYIIRGETSTVQERGKNITLIGYHNKERIKKANRKIWYDIKSPLERRGSASILIPRMIYHNFKVLWNIAEFIPGELFIEFFPPSKCDIEIYLAILNSSVSEIILRAHAQVYGGGTYNISPGEIKNVPIINAQLLTDKQKESLKQAYLQYLSDTHHDRAVIDEAVNRILGIDSFKAQRLKKILEDLLLLATSAKKSVSKM